jgi:hypothetical protein
MAGRLYMTGKLCWAVWKILRVLCFAGGLDDDYNERDEIMVWLDDEQECEESGKMKMARDTHAASTIQMDDQAMEHCG